MKAPLTVRCRAYMHVLRSAMENGASEETCARVIDRAVYDRELPSPDQLLRRIAREHYGTEGEDEDMAGLMEQAA